MNPIDAAPLTEFLQVVENFAISVDCAAFQPRLLDMTK